MSDRVGEQLGNYRLTRLLGRGGFADVYLGEHVYLDSPAAIKVLHTALTREDMEKFRTEARTLARLVHPQIVRLLDFGIEGDIPYLVMDYAPYGSLRQRYPRGIIPPLSTIITFITQVAEALQYAHDEKLIHRDIKPENMLLGRRNEALLSDFGIAVLSRSTHSQRIEDITGTVAYMAPEQLQGRPGRASDQYSLGIVVYEWLSGDVPFHGTFNEIASQHMLTPTPSLRQRVPTLSPAVEKVVLRALEKDPHNRLGSVREFAQALTAAAEPASHGIYSPTVQVMPSRSSQTPADNVSTPHDYTPIPQKTKEAWQNEAYTHYYAGRYQEAVAAYDHAIALSPNDANSYNNRGNAYRALKEYEKAIADYDRVIALDPNIIFAFNNRGNAYRALKEYMKAIADYDRAIALDPNSAFPYATRGVTYQILNDFQRAIQDLNRAIELEPTYVFAYNSRGLAFYALKNYQQAIADYNQAIALDPKFAHAYGNRGLAYYHLIDYQRAIQDFERALQLDPSLTWFKQVRDDAYRKLVGR
jgi:serine/threonine protein kinase